VPYPLKLKALTRFRYFQQREQWKITDFLFSPMVLMMLLPLLLMLILPKMMSDPETKKEMEQLNISKMTSEMPDMSEMITNFLSGGASTSAAKDKEKSKVASKQSKKRNQQQ
jgi:ER membrane protein complex subunit 7